ncbi:MAG: hypothetical protein K2X93_28620 [Candidatus Obscuribacterales bacterium]|nr:hypothetical protein [Candidatus Obscuribacterales bacterium]
MKRDEARKLKKSRVRRIKRIVAGFKRTVRTEADALAYILDLYRQGDGFQCTCGNVLSQDISTRMTKCGECYRDCWVTAGTMFDYAKKLRPYLIAVFLRTNGVDFQKGELADVAGVADSTADEIIKKIAMVLVDQMTGDFQEFSSIAFLEVYKKRSRVTPKLAHPRAEEEEFVAQRAASLTEGKTPIEIPPEAEDADSPALCPQDAAVYDAIPTGSALTFNQLLETTKLSTLKLSHSLVMLEAIHNLIKRIAGERYTRKDPVAPAKVALLRKKTCATLLGQNSGGKCELNGISSLLEYVKSVHGALARKYLQLYAANHWCSIDPARWNNNALFQACLKSEPKPRKVILKYVSPANIRVAAMKMRSSE